MLKIITSCYLINFAWNFFGIQCIHQHNKLTGVVENISLLKDIHLAAIMPSMLGLSLLVVSVIVYSIMNSFK